MTTFPFMGSALLRREVSFMEKVKWISLTYWYWKTIEHIKFQFEENQFLTRILLQDISLPRLRDLRRFTGPNWSCYFIHISLFFEVLIRKTYLCFFLGYCLQNFSYSSLIFRLFIPFNFVGWSYSLFCWCSTWERSTTWPNQRVLQADGLSLWISTTKAEWLGIRNKKSFCK